MIGTKVQIAAKLDVVPGWPGRKPGARGRVSACIDRIDGTVYLVRHDDTNVTARYLRDELTPIRERATEAAAPSPEQARLDELEARVKHAEKRLDGQAISDDRLERAHDRLKVETAELRAIFSDWQQRVVERLEEMAGDERYRAMADAMASELAGLDARPSELSALRGLRRVAEEWWRQACEGGYAGISELGREIGDALLTLDELDNDGSPDEIPEVPAPMPSDACRKIDELQGELDQARADIALLKTQRDDAISRNARALEALREVFDLRPDCTLITDAADDAAQQLRQLKAEIDALTGGEVAAERDPVQGLITQLGQKGLSRATHGLEQLSRHMDLSFGDLQDVLGTLTGDGSGDPRCPATLLAEMCELLLRRGLSGPAPEPGPDSSDGRDGYPVSEIASHPGAALRAALLQLPEPTQPPPRGKA